MRTLLTDLKESGKGYRDMKHCRKSGNKYVGKLKNLPSGSFVQYLFTFYHKKDAEAMKEWFVNHGANNVRIYPVGPSSFKHYEVWENS